MNPERILKRLVLPLAGIILFVIVVAAIAGGDDESAPITTLSTPTTPASLSKSEFIEQGDEICAEANAALANLAAVSDATDAASQEYEITRSELESLQSLPPPDKDRRTLNRFLSALGDTVAALNSKKTAVEQGDDATLASVDSELSTSNAEAEAAAADYGFKDCANAGEAPSDTTTTPTTPEAVTTTPTPIAPTTTTTPATGTPGGGVAPGGGTAGGTGGGTGGGGTGGTGGGSGGVSP
jgi:hypothetical protein